MALHSWGGKLTARAMGKNFDDINEENIEALEDLDASENDDLGIVAETIEGPIDAPVYHLQLDYSYDTFYAVYKDESLKPGIVVVVPTRFGRDLAHIKGPVKEFRSNSGEARITRIERIASTEDLERAKNNRAKEQEAFDICKEKIAQHNLPMKLIKVHYLLEESKILFFFTAKDDERVDFRELVRDLVSIFRTRIELRQIKGRYEFRMSHGGFGICGREYCCHTLAGKLNPVSIKMAKDQNLSLNSMKISGNCGRLLCCLAYEHNFYAEERKLYPPEGYVLHWDDTVWKVKEINCIIGIVTLDSEDGRELLLPRRRFEKQENRNGELVWRIVK